MVVSTVHGNFEDRGLRPRKVKIFRISRDLRFEIWRGLLLVFPLGGCRNRRNDGPPDNLTVWARHTRHVTGGRTIEQFAGKARRVRCIPAWSGRPGARPAGRIPNCREVPRQGCAEAILKRAIVQ